jgi:hypothetical protein
MKEKKTNKKLVDKGRNIRFRAEVYKAVKDFTSLKGYKLGSFCEIAAMDKIKKEANG